MAHGIIATTVKTGFKAYVRATRGARGALATVTGGWGDLVAEARHEREGGRWIEVGQATPTAASNAPAPSTEAADVTTPTPEPTEHPMPDRATGQRAAGTKPRRAQPRPATTPSPAPAPEPVQPAGPDGLAASAPVEEGHPAAEPQPTKAASPPDAAAGTMAHLPPEVRHKLAGDGPIRA